MLIKMKESKGFTLVELMIVVAIIGILAAVAVPYYQRYVAKSRLTSLVMPAIHSIETNISTFYAVRSTWPTVENLTQFQGDADMKFFDLTSDSWVTERKLKITIDAAAELSDGRKPFSAIKANQNWFNLVGTDPDAGTPNAGQKLYWNYDGPLATELGL